MVLARHLGGLVCGLTCKKACLGAIKIVLPIELAQVPGYYVRSLQDVMAFNLKHGMANFPVREVF